MFKHFALALSAILLVSVAPKAQSQTYNGFLLCENCTTAGQFESVARNRVTHRGEWKYAVGNPNTGKFYYVTVFYTPDGEVPLSLPGEPAAILAEGTIAVETRAQDKTVFAQVNPPRGRVTMAAGGTSTAISHPATAEQNAEFQAIVRISNSRIIVNSPQGNNAFDSLAGAQMEQVGRYLWTAMTANNPGWNSKAISSSLRSLLYKAVGWTQGKGPIACIVFNNGDFGCFQLNPIDANASTYVTGTGKDINGNSIERTPNLPNGGGVKTVVRNNAPPGTARFGLEGGSWWLFCSTQGGKPTGCYVQFVAE